MGIYADRALLEQKSNQAFIQALNETYFGRTAGITRCYNAFCDFRDKYVDTSFFRGVKNIDIDHDKDLKIFCEEMERQFGFESFSFIIENSLTQNMMTIPIVFWKDWVKSSDIKKYVYMDKEGYHFRKEANASCIIIAYSQMLLDANFSNEEAFSIVMHEVGHNFQAFINGDMVNLALVRSVIYCYYIALEIYIHIYNGDINGLINDIETMVLISQPSHRTLAKLYNNLTSDTSRNNLYSYFNFIRGLLSVPRNILIDILMFPLAPLLALYTGIIRILSSLNIVGIFMHSYGYAGEQMADNFPSYYGFGRAVASSELKMPSIAGQLASAASKIPIIGHIYNFLLMPAEILTSIGDVHPASITRCKSVINSMKTDLNDPRLSPKLKAKLSKEIADTEKDMDNYFNRAKDAKDPEALKIAYDRLIYITLNGGAKYNAFRSIFNLDKGVLKQSDKLAESANVISDTKII